MKKLMVLLAVGALALSVVGIASAATLEVNIYGASAQLNFWSALANTYLTAGPAACTGAYHDNGGWSAPGLAYHGAKYFIAEAGGPCAAWTGVNAGDVFRIRAAAYDSGDGIQSVANGGTTNPIDAGGCVGKQRTQLNAWLGSAAATNVVGNLVCVDTHLGAADVNGSTIVQQTEGQLDGPAGPVSPTIVAGVDLGDLHAPGDFTSPAVIPQHTCSGTSLGIIDHHPLIVPFGFYANISSGGGDSLNNHLAGLCNNGDAGCTASTVTLCDPSGGNCVAKNITAGKTSLTTGMIQQIFSGAVTDWQSFFPAMPSTPILGCMRVAGSGTMATFDAAVMKTNKNTPGFPNQDLAIGGNNVWFNNTSTDMMNCVNNNPGAIGFADADQSISSLHNTFGAIYFDGQLPTSPNIQNGLYDRFWTLEHIFEPDAAHKAGYVGGYPTAATVGVNGIVTWSATQIPPARAPYWAFSANMKVHKLNDFSYPPQLGPYGAGCFE